MIKGSLYLLGEYANAARDRYADAVWLSGEEKHTGAPVRTFYFGSSRSFDHLVDRLYRGYVTFERCEENCNVLQAGRWLRRALHDQAVDLVLADLPWPYYRLASTARFLHVPGWIVQKLPLPAPWDGVLSRFRKNTKSTDLRKIRKHMLSYRITQECAAAEEFYDTMYLPYAERRFGSLAVIDDRDEIIASATGGGLLQVMQDDHVLGAVVLVRWRKSMHFLWFGLPDGLDDALLDGALSALYYFTIQHAHTQGCTEVNFSYTLPLLNDGIYRYKRKWGAEVHDWPFGRVIMRPRHFGPAIESFFGGQPFITHCSEGLAGKVVVADDNLTPEIITGIVDRYASEGLRSIKIFSTRPLSAAVMSANYPGGVRLFDLSTVANPADEFCAR